MLHVVWALCLSHLALLYHVASCIFKLWPAVSQTKVNDQRYYFAQNSDLSETWSYFIENMSSQFPSNILRLLFLNSVIHGGSWKQHNYQLQYWGVLAFCPTIRVGLAHRQMEVQHWNGHQNQSQVSVQCDWNQQPLLTHNRGVSPEKRTLMEEKRQSSEQKDQQELSQTGM